ncbi:MAG: RidA family protein [Actinobacteria bacterium]|nr:RidA family protein [Actinomycetota bacterium]
MTGPFVYASSLAIDIETVRRLPEADTVAAETRIVMEKIEAQLAAAGLARKDIVKTTCYLSDESHRMEFVGAYKEHFGDGPYPARCTVVLGLAGDCRVQIEAVAETSPTA